MSPKYDLFLCRVVCNALMNPGISRVSHIAVRHVATGPLWPANGQCIREVVDVYSWKAACNNCMHLTNDRFLQRIASLGILLCMMMMLDIFMHFGTWNAGHKNQFLVLILLQWCFKFSFSGRTVNLSHTVYAVSLAVNTEHNAVAHMVLHATSNWCLKLLLLPHLLYVNFCRWSWVSRFPSGPHSLFPKANLWGLVEWALYRLDVLPAIQLSVSKH